MGFISRIIGGSRKCKLPKHFHIRIHKTASDTFGAMLTNVPKGAVVVSVKEGGVLERWNKDNPDKAVRPGFVIEKVNGVSGYWEMLDALKQSGTFIVKITTVPPETFQEDLEDIPRSCSYALRLPQEDPSSKDGHGFVTLPSVVAGTAGIDTCAICLEDVGPEEKLRQLACKHAFHPFCAGRWLAQSATQCDSKKYSCPLCCRRMVHTRDGVVAVGAEDCRLCGSEEDELVL